MPITGEAVLVLDIGTSMLKACLIDSSGNFKWSASRLWSCHAEEGIPGALTFNPEDLLESVKDLGANVVRNSPDILIKGLIISTQRLGFIITDCFGKPLVALPNIDRRATREASMIPDQEKERSFRTAGRWSGAQHLRARLDWIKKNRPEVLSAADHVLSIGGFLEGAFTGDWHWEATTACESAMFRIDTLSFAEEFDTVSGLFGPRRNPGEKIGTLKESVASEMGLPPDTPVFCGAGDTQLGVLGAGGLNKGDTVIVAGSSAPVNTVIDSPVYDAAFRAITNPHVISGKWLMEANAMMTGTSFQWVKNLLWGNEWDANDAYARMSDLAKEELFRTREPAEISLFAGANVANARLGNTYPMGCLSFSMRDASAQKVTRGAVALSVFEATVYAMLGNMGLLEECVGKPSRIIIGGGETKLPFLLELLSGLAPVPVYLSRGDDLTCLGAAMLAWNSILPGDTLPGTVKRMIRLEEIPKTDLPNNEVLKKRKENWIRQVDLLRQ